MPVPWQRVYQAASTAAVTLITTAETIVQTLNGVSTEAGGQIVSLLGILVLTTGTNTTTVTVRIRRGTTLSGTLVGVAEVDTGLGAAGSTDPYVIGETDSPGEVASQSYVLTVQQAAASANGATIMQQLVATLF